jgi:CRISPR/Cas system-associated exonuclease Cas4 (RecB family)
MCIQQQINDGLEKALAKGRRSYPRYVHRISDVGHPCKRYLYYAIHDWDKQKELDLYLLGIFKTGDMIEDAVIPYFNAKVGRLCDPPLTILDIQAKTADPLLKKYRIEGSRDGTLARDERPIKRLGPLDGKSCSDAMYRQYNDIESLKRHPWSFKYYAQIMLYAFAANEERGFLMFVNKQNAFFQWKVIEVPIDYEYVEGILQKCEDVNEHIDAEIPPEKINQPFWCKGCWFEDFCVPELKATGDGPKINESQEIEDLVTKLNLLKEDAAEYKRTYDLFKSKLVKGQTLILKNAMVQWSVYDVNRKAQEASSYTVHKPKIVPYDREPED